MTDELFQLMDSLPDVLHEIWRKLARAVAVLDDPWHFPAIATTDTDGPRVRTMVLRDVNADLRLLTCHTDARSPKVQTLSTDPRVCLLVYDPREKLQVQFNGNMTIHIGDAVARAQWEKTDLPSRRAYLAPQPPGVQIPSPGVNLPEQFRNR